MNNFLTQLIQRTQGVITVAKPLIAPFFAQNMAIGGDFWAFSTFNPSSLQEKTKSDLDKKSGSLDSQNQSNFTLEVTEIMPLLPSGYWSVNRSRLHQINILEPFEFFALNDIDSPESSSLEVNHPLDNHENIINDVETNNQLFSQSKPLTENKITSQVNNSIEELSIKDKKQNNSIYPLIENKIDNIDRKQEISTVNESVTENKITSQVNNVREESRIKNEKNNQTIYPLVENKIDNIDKKQEISTVNESVTGNKTTSKANNVREESRIKNEKNNQTIYPLVENKIDNIDKKQEISTVNEQFTENQTTKSSSKSLLKQSIFFSRQQSPVKNTSIVKVHPSITPKQSQECNNSHYLKPKAEEETSISINIGRIIVRPAQETPKESKTSHEKRKTKKPNLSLKDYLKQRRT
ncbi:hypothetical protein [Crocosphaera sp.]|uniref:hypothetical protein n=1 Tax=Crocosphaera sp. TaxID=2729996 RepID=UPI00262A1CE1|nr:hypothetical protein [Crocosphaera sp.]MDJ0582128.1 hypothetical protein [Crocosphaera sp.]